MDLIIAGAVAVGYGGLVVLLLPVSEYPRALGGALVAIAAVAGAARVLGRGPVRGLSVFVVIVASAMVLWFPTFPALGGKPRTAIPLGFLGVQAVALLWAALRWQPRAATQERLPLRRAWMLGAYGALGLGVIATIPIAVLFLSGHGEPRLLWVYPAYLVGGLGAATVFWALQGVAHLATGRYLLGALSGLCLYGAIAPVVMLVERGPLDASLMLTIAAIAGFVVGPAVAFELDRWPAAT